MKKLFAVLLLLPGLALASTFNLFSPATGILKGSSTTYVTTAAVGSDVTALFTGSCTAASFLRADGVCSIIYASTEPQSGYSETDQGTDLKNWIWDINGGIVQFGTATDAAPTTLVNPAIKITRGATTVLTNITLGYSVAASYTFPFTGTATFSGAVSGTRFNFSSGVSASGDSVYSPSGGQIGLSTSGTQRLLLTTNFTLTTALISGGTTFTVSGCSNSAHAGGAFAGTVTLGANSCSLVVTPGQTAPTGWTCQAHDRNAPTVLIGGESSSNATTATFTIPVTAGSTDVISFSCTGF